MKKYTYEVVDKNNKVMGAVGDRKTARWLKGVIEKDPMVGEEPPCKIVRYELANPTVIR